MLPLPPEAVCPAGRLRSEGLGSLKRSVKTILSGTNGGSLSHPQRNPYAPLKQASSRLSLYSTAPEWGPMIGSLEDTRWAPDFKRQQGDRQQGGPYPASHSPSFHSVTDVLSVYLVSVCPPPTSSTNRWGGPGCVFAGPELNKTVVPSTAASLLGGPDDGKQRNLTLRSFLWLTERKDIWDIRMKM